MVLLSLLERGLFIDQKYLFENDKVIKLELRFRTICTGGALRLVLSQFRTLCLFSSLL